MISFCCLHDQVLKMLPCEINYKMDIKMSKYLNWYTTFSQQCRTFFSLLIEKLSSNPHHANSKWFVDLAWYLLETLKSWFSFMFLGEKNLWKNVLYKKTILLTNHIHQVYILPLWPLIVMCETNLINAAHFQQPVYEHCMGAWRRWCFWCCSCWW